MPLGSILFCNDQQYVKGRGPFRSETCLPASPGFAGIAQDLEERLIIIFVVEQDAISFGKEQDITLRRQPLEISQTFLEGVPVMTEVVREVQNARKFRE